MDWGGRKVQLKQKIQEKDQLKKNGVTQNPRTSETQTLKTLKLLISVHSLWMRKQIQRDEASRADFKEEWNLQTMESL